MLKSLFNWFGSDSKEKVRSRSSSPPPKPSTSTSNISRHVIVDEDASVISMPSSEDNIRWPNVIKSTVVEKRIIPPVSGLLMRGEIEDKISSIMNKFDSLELDSPRPKRKSQ